MLMASYTIASGHVPEVISAGGRADDSERCIRARSGTARGDVRSARQGPGAERRRLHPRLRGGRGHGALLRRDLGPRRPHAARAQPADVRDAHRAQPRAAAARARRGRDLQRRDEGRVPRDCCCTPASTPASRRPSRASGSRARCSPRRGSERRRLRRPRHHGLADGANLAQGRLRRRRLRRGPRPRAALGAGARPDRRERARGVRGRGGRRHDAAQRRDRAERDPRRRDRRRAARRRRRHRHELGRAVRDAVPRARSSPRAAWRSSTPPCPARGRRRSTGR